MRIEESKNMFSPIELSEKKQTSKEVALQISATARSSEDTVPLLAITTPGRSLVGSTSHASKSEWLRVAALFGTSALGGAATTYLFKSRTPHQQYPKEKMVALILVLSAWLTIMFGGARACTTLSTTSQTTPFIVSLAKTAVLFYVALLNFMLGSVGGEVWIDSFEGQPKGHDSGLNQGVKITLAVGVFLSMGAVASCGARALQSFLFTPRRNSVEGENRNTLSHPTIKFK